MSYDAVDQITGVGYRTNNIVKRSVAYQYDAVGNRTQVQDNGGLGSITTAYSANNLNQYTAVGTDTPTYDANGNQTNHNGWAMTYDRENRLLSASSASLAVNYSYDAQGRLIERRTSGATTTTNRMYYAGWQLIAEYNGTGALQRKYVYGPGIDEPVRMTNGGTNYYYHVDGLGSVTEITDGTGNLVESYRYDVYGTPTIYDAAGSVLGTSALRNSVLFTGRLRDPDTGWYNYRHRYYNPALGRFVQPDPIRFMAGDVNLYRYVLNNPTGRVDPRGLDNFGGQGQNYVGTASYPQPQTTSYAGPGPIDRLGNAVANAVNQLNNALAMGSLSQMAEMQAMQALIPSIASGTIEQITAIPPNEPSTVADPRTALTAGAVQIAANALDALGVRDLLDRAAQEAYDRLNRTLSQMREYANQDQDGKSRRPCP